MTINNCIFCEIIKENIKSKRIYESKHSLAILDAYPLRKGHTLVITKSHKSKIQDLSPDENHDIFSTMHLLIPKIEEVVNCSSSLIAIHNGKDAGQEIPHVHIHIVPIKASEKKVAIHSMFDKTFLDEKEQEDIQKKITKGLV